MHERNLRASIANLCDGSKIGGGGHLYQVQGVAGQGQQEKVALRHKCIGVFKALSEGNGENGNHAGVRGADQ